MMTHRFTGLAALAIGAYLALAGCNNPASQPQYSTANAARKAEIMPATPQEPDKLSIDYALIYYNTYKNQPEVLNGLPRVMKKAIAEALYSRMNPVRDAEVLFLERPTKVYYDADLLMPLDETNYSEPALFSPVVAKRSSGEKSVVILGLGWTSRYDWSSNLTKYAERRTGENIADLEVQRKSTTDESELSDIDFQIEILKDILSVKK